ncbi:hypothetical protein BRARA_C04626 [Brassica rapa]|uniref:LOB domain-containing protein n=1 Tax=Brassica campestris TaxID=3711 RepID=A0A398A4J8_BRACM|nr:hypothetical protein BRARA_C04626 [Brassica rapa]
MAIWAACEFMTGPCTFGNGNACIMAPYFPLTEPKKFDRINKVFGVVNVYKILSRLEELWQHQYAVNALCYEAEARIHDPIHGYLEGNRFCKKMNCQSPWLRYRNIQIFLYLVILQNLFLFFLTNEMLELNENQKNQLTRLPDVDARRNVDKIVGMRENDQGDVHRADGASTSS